jgi:cystathionine beta-lyase
LLGIVLHPVPKHAVDALLNCLVLFAMGASFGGFESLAIPVNPGHYRDATRWTAEGPCLRLHVGLEDPGDLIADLEQGFARMHTATAEGGA